MDLFWIMYQVLEEEDDYLIFLFEHRLVFFISPFGLPTQGQPMPRNQQAKVVYVDDPSSFRIHLFHSGNSLVRFGSRLHKFYSGKMLYII
jgi:hypothetical protein